MARTDLAVVDTHPVQYRAPVYRALQQQGVRVTAIYGSDFSIAGYRDREFGATFAWDTDLLSGYESLFLSRARAGDSTDEARIPHAGIGAAIDRLQPAAVMVVGYSPTFHRVALYEAWRRRRSILFRGETTDSAVDRRWPARLARDAALKVAYGACDALLYIGQQSLAHFRRLGVPDTRLFFSPYGVDASTFEPGESSRDRLRAEARLAAGVAAGQIAILYAGKLSERKGLALVVPAIRALPEAVRDRIVLMFLGDGALRDEIASAAQADPAVQVRFLGFHNQRELSRQYHAADLLILPSLRSETWGLVVNEALHHGVPCVVSDRVGCAPDLIEPGVTGNAFSSGSPSSFAACLESSLALAGREEIRAACRRKVADYSVARAASGIADALVAVAARERRRAS